jgi:acetyltransferase-like isoleucine patch superfamily enzyme
MKREKCDINEATEKRKEITKKWLDSFPRQNYSNISQELFWNIHENIKNDYKKIHFAEILNGNNVFIGENTQIWSASKIIIEDNVMISHGVNIIDTNSHPKNANLRSQHHLEIITKGHPIQGQIVSQIESFPIIIKKNSWISFNVTILKNVSIGENSIVGANTVINKNIKDNTIVFSEIKNIEKKIDNK